MPKVFRSAKRNLYKNRVNVAATGLAVLFVVLSFGAAHGLYSGPVRFQGNAITYDEVSHIGSAYYYDHNYRYYFNPEHPPLVKMIVGIPLQFLHVKPGKIDQSLLTNETSQWNYGRSFLFIENQAQTSKIINTARFTVTIFNAVLLMLVFLLLKRLVSARAALIGLALLVFNPVILGHASLVAFDVPAGLTIALGLLAYAYYLQKPTYKRVTLVIVTLAIALVTKYSTTFLIPVFLLAGPLWLVYKRAPRSDYGRWLAQQAIILVAALFLVSTVMIPLTIHMNSEALTRQFSENWPGHLKGSAANILPQLTRLGVYPKAFAAWLNGLLIIQNVVDLGKGGTVFLGHLYGVRGPGPFYYPLLYLTKLPSATILLVIGTFIYAIRDFAMRGYRKTRNMRSLYLVLGLFCIAYWLFVTHAPFKIGIRHFFPFVVASLLLVGVLADKYWSSWVMHKRLRYYHLFYASLILMITSTLISFPYYISYYNIFAGGTSNGYRIAVDSNYDWGQDLTRLGNWEAQHNVPVLYTDVFTNPWGAEQHYLVRTHDVDSILDYKTIPKGSYVAVSANQLELRQAASKQTYAELYKTPPIRVGTTIFIFQKP